MKATIKKKQSCKQNKVYKLYSIEKVIFCRYWESSRLSEFFYLFSKWISSNVSQSLSNFKLPVLFSWFLLSSDFSYIALSLMKKAINIHKFAFKIYVHVCWNATILHQQYSPVAEAQRAWAWADDHTPETQWAWLSTRIMQFNKT